MWIFKEKSKKNLENLEEKWFESLNFRHIFTVQTVFFTFIVYIFGCVPSTCWEFQWNWIEWLWPFSRKFLINRSHSWEKAYIESDFKRPHADEIFQRKNYHHKPSSKIPYNIRLSLVKLPKFMNLQGRIQAYVDLIWFFFFYLIFLYKIYFSTKSINIWWYYVHLNTWRYIKIGSAHFGRSSVPLSPNNRQNHLTYRLQHERIQHTS